jgi:biotin carboxyl carrier protein
MLGEFTTGTVGRYEQVFVNVGDNVQKGHDKLQAENKQAEFSFGQGTERFRQLLLP